MRLAALQRTMVRAVMQPLTSTERMQNTAPDGKPMREYASQFIKPNDRLSSFERLEIYNRQYWFRLLSSMIEDFPGLRAVLGDRKFEAMSKAYLVDCPSQSFTLRNLGARLEAWLRKRVQVVAKLDPAEIFLAVHRVDDSVYFRRIEREEFVILGALRDGKSLGSAIAAGFRKSRVPSEERAESVRKWFQNWAALGWF